MQDQPRGGGADRAMTTDDEDTREERRVLREVLTYYPGSFTVDELIRELTVGSTKFGDQDAVRRAVRELASTGLVHEMDGFLLPTRSAVHFHELADGGEI